MFANIIRTQSRNVLASCATRVAAANLVGQLAARRPMVSLLSMSRPLSTSRPCRNGYESQEYTREVVRPKNPPSTTLFLGNLPFSIEEQDIRDKFEPFGAIRVIRIAYRSDGTTRGFAHIEYVNKEDAIGAMQSASEEPIYLLDRDIRVDYAPPRVDVVHEPYHKLYFYDFRGDESTLRTLAREFESSIISVYFLKNPHNGDPTGSGFIDFMSVERATEALAQLNGQVATDGTKLSLSYARPPRTRSNEGGQRGQRAGYGGDWGGSRRNIENESRGPSRGGYGGGGRGGGGGYGGGGREGSFTRGGDGGERGYSRGGGGGF